MRSIGRGAARGAAAISAGLAVLALASCTGAAMTASPHLASHQTRTAQTCRARSGWAAITLTDTAPAPAVTVRTGERVIVTVPPWGWGQATEVGVASGGILREECTVLLPGRGRRTIFLATGPGRTRLDATVEPASNLAMPAWSGDVVVRGEPNRT
jgi:hypothetical protein